MFLCPMLDVDYYNEYYSTMEMVIRKPPGRYTLVYAHVVQLKIGEALLITPQD